MSRVDFHFWFDKIVAYQTNEGTNMKHTTFNKNEIMDLLFNNDHVYVELPLNSSTGMMISRSSGHPFGYKNQSLIEVRFYEKDDDGSYMSYATEYFNKYNIENAVDAVLMRHSSEDPMEISGLSKSFELTFEKH